MSMKVGTLCYATDQGLGILAKSFHDAGVVTHPLVIRHGSRHTHDEWYPGAPQCTDLSKQLWMLQDFCKSVDVMLFFETPFVWPLIDFCRENKIKTVLMPMYECMPKVLPYQPDAIINPSALDQQYYPSGTFIPVPVEGIEWKKRERARVFVHNAGHGGLKGRNGTDEFMEAIRLVKTPAEFIVRSQDVMRPALYAMRDHWRYVGYGTIPREKLYDEGDVFIFPEKFNGLSLPLQEARAAGMLVMCGDRFPMNDWLPTKVYNAHRKGDPLFFAPHARNPLIPVDHYNLNAVSGRCNEFHEAVFSPEKIAAKIDEWYDRDISQYSQSAIEWAKSMSWEALKPRYMKFFEETIG